MQMQMQVQMQMQMQVQLQVHVPGHVSIPDGVGNMGSVLAQPSKDSSYS